MKNVLLFVAIITICGSLMRATVYRMCETDLKCRYYLKGNLVNSNTNPNWKLTGESGQYIDHSNGNKKFYADSIIIEPHYSTYRMLDK